MISICVFVIAFLNGISIIRLFIEMSSHNLKLVHKKYIINVKDSPPLIIEVSSHYLKFPFW